MEFLGFGVTSWLVGGAAVLLLWLTSRKPRHLPPGPAFALPLVGHLPLLRGDPRKALRRMRERYGDIFHLYMVRKLVIVFSGYDVIKEALVNHGEVFSDRPHMFITDEISKNMG